MCYRESHHHVAGAGDQLNAKRRRMRNTLTAAIFAASLVTLFAGSASAQPFDNDVMTRCNQSVGAMKFDGWPADRNREMMMSACQHNGGAVPGAWSNQN